MEWCWNGIRFSLPEQWEMLQFSKNAQEGRCAFADRYQFRFELNWSQVAKPLDMERLASDYVAKLHSDGQSQAKALAHEEWHGAGCEENGRHIARYSRCFPESLRLIETVFIHPVGEAWNGQDDLRILESLALENQPSGLGPVHWRAFGMDWTNGEGLSCSACQCSCGFAETTFTDDHERIRQTFSRRGLTEQWLKMPVDAWLARQLPNGYRTISESRRTVNGHEEFFLTAAPRHANFGDWLHGARRLCQAAFLCPKDGRLYQVANLVRLTKHGSPSAMLSCGCGVCATAEVAS